MPNQIPPFESIVDIPTDVLRFDAHNPRLEDGIDGNEPVTDRQIIKWLRSVAALDELIASISNNGYKRIEPLVIHGPDEGPFTVLEGNRRLACIRLLQDPALADEVGVRVPKPVPADVLASIQTVPVYRVRNPEDARAFIGFKHINGPHRWESFAKAKYVTDWWLAEKANGVTITDIAEKLGDDNNTIRNMIAGMLVLEQGKSLGFDIADRANKGRFAFSHLYTALSRSEYVEFLGLQRGWAQALEPEPVPADKQSELKEVLLWLYGSKANQKQSLIKSQNPDLAHLGEAVKHPVALQVIRGGGTLQQAKQEFRPTSALLNELLVEINLKLREATQLAGRTEKMPEALKEIVKEIALQAGVVEMIVGRVIERNQGEK